MPHPRKRLPENPQYHLWYHPYYLGIPVQTQKGPLIQEYLDRTYHLFDLAHQAHDETLFLRFDLRFPLNYDLDEHRNANDYISAFFKYLKDELRSTSLAHRPDPRYLWAREQTDPGYRPHYHCALLLNANAISTIGDIHTLPDGTYSADNLYHRLVRCWAKALGLPADRSMSGIINISTDFNGALCFYRLHRADSSGWHHAFYLSSYLCKAATKPFGLSFRVFGSSVT